MITYKPILDIEEYAMVDCFGVGEKKAKLEAIFALSKLQTIDDAFYCLIFLINFYYLINEQEQILEQCSNTSSILYLQSSIIYSFWSIFT